MNTRQPATEIRPDQATNIQNAKISLDGLSIAWGYTEIGDVVGDSDTVIRKIVLFRQLDGTTALIRVTNDHAYTSTGGAWTKISLASGTAMTGTDLIVGAAMIQDSLLIAKAGESALIRYTGTTGNGGLTEISGSPAARFIVPFADRAVASYTSANPQIVQWSVSGDITDWSGAGSGSSSLVEDPSGAMDEITGLSVQGDHLMVYRRFSIWVGTRTGVSSPAIALNSRVQGTGCIAERSLVNIGSKGDIFLGSDDVYLYHPGDREPTRIGTPIQNEIFDNLNRSGTEHVHAAYVRDRQKYSLFIPVSSDTYATRGYEFDIRRFRTNGDLVWERRDPNDGSDNISASFGGRTGSLTDPDSEHKLVLGTDVGETFDSDTSDTTDDGGTVTLTYESPEFNLKDRWLQMTHVDIGYTATVDSDITLSTSTDGGANWIGAKTYTLPASTAVRPYPLRVRSVVGRSVMFRLQSTDTNRPVFRTYRLALLPRGEFRGRYR